MCCWTQIFMRVGFICKLADGKPATALLEGAAKDAAAHGDQRRTAIALNNLGMGRVARGRFDEALPYFERVLSLAAYVTSSRMARH